MERICGRNLVTLYNVANGVMFCFLAGAMVTVNATAAGAWFDLRMPGLNDLYPNSMGWAAAVFVMGALITVVAAYGYNFVARVANIAAPWLVLVFIAFGIVGLRQLGIDSVSGFWSQANALIWTGGAPLPGQVKFTFWHVLFFAWFCNMAMHIGMADLTVFRYARKSWYAVATAAGMYLGHFIAWLAASVLYAVQLHATPGRTDVLPGPMAYNACGVAGLVCVIVAGWTTANPTIYRAGLAFQAIVPSSSRYRVTLFTGAVATVAGLFPAIAMKLLGFVALYGLILMPMGAVVFVDFWLARRLGFRPNEAEASGSEVQLGGGPDVGAHHRHLPRDRAGGRSADLLRGASRLVPGGGAVRRAQSDLPAKGGAAMRALARFVSLVALVGTIVPPLLFFAGRIDLAATKGWMLAATVAWFAATPLWMERRLSPLSPEP